MERKFDPKQTLVQVGTYKLRTKP